MNWTYTLYKKKNIVPGRWDGGQTFEYMIYPAASVYADKDFVFRISSASIEKVPSVFTRFKGYTRFLVMLDNDLKVLRNGVEECYTPQDVFVFDSGDNIVSYSPGNDFNLMVCHRIAHTRVQLLKGSFSADENLIFFFARNKTYITNDAVKLHLEPFDLVVIENPLREHLRFFTDEMMIAGYFLL